MRPGAPPETSDAEPVMFDLLLTDCHLATMRAHGAPYGAIPRGAVGIEKGIITWIGPEDDLPTHRALDLRKLGGAWVTPGLIDCHTHFIFGGNRIADFERRNTGASYQEIAAEGGGILSTVRATRTASLAELIQDATRRLSAFLAEGVTTMEIKSGYGLTLEDETKCLKAATQLGTNNALTVVRTFLGAHCLPPEFSSKDEYIRTISEEWLPLLQERSLVDAVDGYCEHIAFSTHQIERLFKAATGLGLKIKLHAEQLSPMGAARLAAKYGAVSADHLEYATEEDVAALAQAGSSAVLLPGAFFTLREKQSPPLALLRQYRVPIALASDHNPGTSPLTSLLPALNLAVILFHLTPEEALAGVTRNAALALGLPDRGVLDIGKRADLAVWQIDRPAALSYWLGGGRCHMTIHAGQIR